MPHSTLEERREYMRNWRAGIRRTKVDQDGNKYLDSSLTHEMREYDRAVREAARKREESRKLRQQRCIELQQHYKQRIAELCERPFSWQESR